MQTDESKKCASSEDAVASLAEFGEQVIYGGMAFVVTTGVMHYGFGFEVHEAVEPAVLNAGIAYYTHAASGRIIRAIVVLAKPRIAKVTKTQKVVIEDE